MNLPTEDLYNYIRNLDEEMIRGIIMEGTNNQNLNFLIINLIARLEHANITLPYEVMSRKVLSQFNRKLCILSVVYRDYSSFNSQMIRFRNHRAALIYKLSTSANELDRNSSRITLLKLFGYIVVVISSLNLGIFLGRDLMKSFLKISPFPSIQKLFIAASCYGPICFAVSYADYLRCKYIINCITDMIEEDKRLFAQISNSNLEIDVMRFFYAELFSQTTDEEVIKNVKHLAGNENLTITEKILATVVISNMKNDPSCLKDIRFLYKTYLFSRTQAAAIWYNRLSHYIDPEDKNEYIRIMKDGSLQLKMIRLTSSLPIEFLLTPSILNRVVLSGLHSLCFFYEIRKFKHANTCVFSNDLRQLAIDSQNVLEITRPAQSFRS